MAGKDSPVFRGASKEYEGIDSYSERLVKFVPAEVLAFFVPAAANWGDERGAILAIFAVCFVATPLYLWVRSRDAPAPFRFYVFASVAFLAWAIGTSPPTGDLFGLTPQTGGLFLALAAFLVPLVDDALDQALHR